MDIKRDIPSSKPYPKTEFSPFVKDQIDTFLKTEYFIGSSSICGWNTELIGTDLTAKNRY